MPDVLDRVQFGRSGWQQHQREVVWHDEVLGAVPSGPVHQQDPMGSGSHGLRDFRQVQAHGLRVASKAWLLAIVRNLFLSSATARSSGRTVSLEAYVRPDCGEPDDPARELWDPDQDTPETALIRSSELEAPGTGSYPPLALSLGRLGQQVSVDP